MNKTLHQKLTSKYHYANSCLFTETSKYDIIATQAQDMKILQLAINDLLSPRPEAINRILEMSRML